MRNPLTLLNSRPFDPHGEMPPKHAVQQPQPLSGDQGRFSSDSRSGSPGTTYTDTPPEPSVRGAGDGQRSDSWGDRPPETLPDFSTATTGHGLDGRGTSEASDPKQGLGATGPSPQQRLQESLRAIAALKERVRASNPPAQGGRLGAQSQASTQSQGLHFTPATPAPKRDAGAPSPQSGIPTDLDWANADLRKRKEPPFPSAAERRMTEQERSLAEIGENVNLDSLHELQEWNKSINEGRPVEDKPKPNPPLLPGQKRVSESEMQSHLAHILNHAKISDFDAGGKYHDQRYVETARGPVDLKHIIASGTPFSALTILPVTAAWETSQGLNKNYRQSAFAPEDLRSNAIGAGASDKSWPEFMSGKTFGDEAARLIGKMGFNSLPYGR